MSEEVRIALCFFGMMFLVCAVSCFLRWDFKQWQSDWRRVSDPCGRSTTYRADGWNVGEGKVRHDYK